MRPRPLSDSNPKDRFAPYTGTYGAPTPFGFPVMAKFQEPVLQHVRDRGVDEPIARRVLCRPVGVERVRRLLGVQAGSDVEEVGVSLVDAERLEEVVGVADDGVVSDECRETARRVVVAIVGRVGEDRRVKLVFDEVEDLG